MREILKELVKGLRGLGAEALAFAGAVLLAIAAATVVLAVV